MFKKALLGVFITSIILILVGLILIKGDFEKVVDAFVSDQDYELVEVLKDDTFINLDIKLTSHNIEFYKSTDDTFKAIYYESDYDKINFEIEDNSLIIKGDYRKKYRFFGLKNKSNEMAKIQLFLPNYFNGEVKTKLTSGKITIKDFNFKSLDLYLTSGKLDMNNIEVNNNLNINITSGTILLENIKVNNLTNINSTSGVVNVKDSVLNKVDISATSGKINVEKIITNEISTYITSGKTTISIIGNKDDYMANLNVTSGSIYYDGSKISSQQLNQNGAKTIKSTSTSGPIYIDFIEN